MFKWEDGRIVQKRNGNGDLVDTDTAYKEAGFPSECRDFDVAGEILRIAGFKSVRLVTNNPRKIKGIESAGIRVEQVEIHIKPANGIIANDLRSKALNLGHTINKEHWSL